MGCQCTKSSAVSEPKTVPQQTSAATSGARRGGAATSAAPSKEVIAKKIQQAQSTRILALRECALKSLPDALSSADGSKFRTIDLSVNAIVTLPDAIGTWVNVEKLLCPQNSLKELPRSIGGMQCLQKLVLSNNKLNILPAELSNLKSLKLLHLDANCLGPRLPDVFGALLAPSLEELDLANNNLQELAPSLSGLCELTRLVLSGNQIQKLEGLGSLVKLRYLDAADNKVTSVPSDLLEKTSISELWLKGNPIDRLVLKETPGFNAFLERRKQRLDAKIDSNVVGGVNLNMCGLE